MKKRICKVCKKEYYLEESAKDSGCCSQLCESRALLMACRNGHGDRCEDKKRD